LEKGHSSRDVLGRVYEYFIGKFASAEGKRGGEFYTPSSIVRTLVEMVEPYKGRVYDPACGSGGMFVQSEKFVESHGGNLGDISVYGQESNPTTWRLCKMNLAIRGVEANLGQQWGDSFHENRHAALKADFILANPPFNDSNWGGDKLKEDVRWKYGTPPSGNANFAWLQHVVSHLSPSGVAGVVLANGSMSSQQSGEGEIRRNLVKADLVDCMVALPGQLFYNTQIPACLWFLARNKGARGHRARKGEVLFIDARNLGNLVDRTRREFSDEDIARIARTYHAWRGEKGAGEYTNVPGFCKAQMLDQLETHDFVLTPGRYVDAQETERDEEPFDVKVARLAGKLREQISIESRLNARIVDALEKLGYGS
jgi:type I restriction enzyme M protein